MGSAPSTLSADSPLKKTARVAEDGQVQAANRYRVLEW